MTRENVFSGECRYDPGSPEGFRAGALTAGSAANGNALAVRVIEIPPGQWVCPYHYEYEEEWLIVLEGEVTVRTPAGEEQVERGAIMAFPPGPDGAHKVGCRGQRTARVVMFSSAREPAVAVYPDSDKIGVWPGDEADHAMLFRKDGGVDYYAGEA